ncbi:MAG: GIY-YIG nuclease family protein [Lysobacter sp.]|nr:GIY-YIG nuclease family protein [Lysobacter sp.]
MAPIDRRDQTGRIPSRGRCFLYVLPCAFEDQLKLGFSRNPLDRMQSLHRRYFEVFDLDRAFLVETETVRDARALELSLRRQLVAHNAPAPLTVRREAGGHTEWYRGAYQQLAEAAVALSQGGYVVHDPLRSWLRDALVARSDLLYSWTEAMLSHGELESVADEMTTLNQRVARDALDAYAALGIDLEPLLPGAVLRWHWVVSRQ